MPAQTSISGGQYSALQTSADSRGSPATLMCTPLPESHKQLIKQSLQANELGPISPYQLSHAGTDKSGYSFGLTQFDLGQGTGRGDGLVSLAKNSKDPAFSTDELSSLKSCLATVGSPDCLSQSTVDKTNLLLAKNKEFVDRIDEAQLNKVYANAQAAYDNAKMSAKYGTDPAYTKFVDSGLMSAMVADNYNQFGSANDLIAAASNDDAGMQKIVGIESNYKYVEKGHGADLVRRRGNIVDIAEKNGSITASERAELQYQINSGYR